MQTAHELFLHELSEILDAEHRILETLSQQSEENNNSALQSGRKLHPEEKKEKLNARQNPRLVETPNLLLVAFVTDTEGGRRVAQ
jgi:ferritin-like metal-binding protein YciE